MTPPTTGPKAPRKNRAGHAPDTLESRIRACYGALPGSERAVAEFMLHHPSRLLTHSATELAAEAGASKAAVTRLIQRLGYASYAEARAKARDAQQWGSPIYLEAAEAPEQGRHGAMAAHIAADQQVLARTQQALTERDLDGAVDALAGARRVLVIGFRNSAWLALYARSQIGLLRPGVELAPMPSETLAESMVGLTAEDVVLAIGLRRRTPTFAAALAAARAASARIVLVTDPSGLADLGRADWTLTCHCRGASMFDSYVAAVSLINFLAVQLAQSLGAEGRMRLQEVEQWHERLGDLV